MTVIEHEPYGAGMEIIDSEIPDQVIAAAEEYDPSAWTERDVAAALAKDSLSIEDFAALLSPAAAPLIGRMAERARSLTLASHGDRVALFTPLYIANYCNNRCVYCGFHSGNQIKRARLETDEIERELTAIAATGLQDILLLTGESRKMSDVPYIGEAVKLAAARFRKVGIEIYPLNTDEYAYLGACGASYVCVYQETYDPERYKQLHLYGPKRVYPYRLNAQERALRGGIRGVGFGALLGLGDFRKDAFATGVHVQLVRRKYPQAEISFSVPRLRPCAGDGIGSPLDVGEEELRQVMLAYRLLMPSASMTISTRERAEFRDSVVGLCATKISAGVSVGVGGHAEEERGDGQFVISDSRSIPEICSMITAKGLQPVM